MEISRYSYDWSVLVPRIIVESNRKWNLEEGKLLLEPKLKCAALYTQSGIEQAITTQYTYLLQPSERLDSGSKNSKEFQYKVKHKGNNQSQKPNFNPLNLQRFVLISFSFERLLPLLDSYIAPCMPFMLKFYLDNEKQSKNYIIFEYIIYIIEIKKILI